MKKWSIFLLIRMVVVFSLVHAAALFLPALIFQHIVLRLIGGSIFQIAVGMLISILNVILLLLMATVCTGIAAQILRLRYSGDHSLDLSNKEVRNWLLSLSIYLPLAIILDLFHVYPLKTVHIRLFGGRIGKGVIIGGLVTDPMMLEIGDYTVIGGFTKIYGHTVEHRRIKFDKVRIGSTCSVGSRATVLAGSAMENRSMLAAQSLLTKNSVIPSGRTFIGVPAKEVTEKLRGRKRFALEAIR